MIPLVGEVKELKYVKNVVVETADAEIEAAGSDLQYKVGTMIEIPRAALTADEIAKEAEFFCFGTNDLTQMTFGFSRDDAGKFLDAYYDKKIYENDPFREARSERRRQARWRWRSSSVARPARTCKLGICGEHGGDPSSVEFCHKIGLDLRLLLAVPCADRKTGSGSGGSQERVKKTAPRFPKKFISTPRSGNKLRRFVRCNMAVYMTSGQ